MVIFMKRFLAWFQEKRDLYLSSIGRALFSLGISANVMTAFSLLCGWLAVFYLFNNHLLFIIFGALHLIADGLDGVIARSSKASNAGKYFDYLTDRSIVLLLLLKISFVIDIRALFVAVLFVLVNLIYLYSKFEAPVLFTRTIFIILLFLELPTLAYLITALAYCYGLLRQLYYVKITRRL